MLARQISLRNPLRTKLTPLLRYSYKLLVVPKKANSFAIKQIQTLPAKHAGWGIYRPPLTAHHPLPPSFVFTALQIPTPRMSIHINPVLMHLQIPFPANLLFAHLYKTPGCHPCQNLLGPIWNGHSAGRACAKQNAPEGCSGASTNYEPAK